MPPGRGSCERAVLRYGDGVTTFSLRTVKLRPGEQFRDVVDVTLQPLELGGQRYVPVPESPEAVLSLTQTSSGLVLELELDVRVLGPCMRCLEPAGHEVSVDAREVDQPGGGEELSSPYLDEDQLDVAAWARDALALALPTQIVCRADCKGLCPVCGENLNEAGPEHFHEAEPGGFELARQNADALIAFDFATWLADVDFSKAERGAAGPDRARHGAPGAGAGAGHRRQLSGRGAAPAGARADETAGL